MGSLMGSFFGSQTNKSADETIAISSLAATAVSAQTYLASTLESTTPEVRRLFSEYSTQSVMAQEALSALAIKKGWISPYDLPTKQLETSMQDSYTVLSAQ